MGEYERKMAKEIKGMKKGKEMWNMIYKLKGEKVKKKDEMKIYNEEGEEMENIECQEEMTRYWQGIYTKNGNRMDEVWNEEKKREYENIVRETRERENDTREMGLPRVGDPYRNVKTMKLKIEKKDVERAFRRIKGGKSGGIDGLKPEMYKEMAGYGGSMEAFREAIERIVEEGGEPDSWKMSRTVMIKKKRKPEVKDLRPIALTDVSYKVMMSVIKDKIEQHIGDNGMNKR